jgi:7,8-dihydro-6-hydroxymethylpterin-pyrophosphokinase
MKPLYGFTISKPQMSENASVLIPLFTFLRHCIVSAMSNLDTISPDPHGTASKSFVIR